MKTAVNQLVQTYCFCSLISDKRHHLDQGFSTMGRDPFWGGEQIGLTNQICSTVKVFVIFTRK